VITHHCTLLSLIDSRIFHSINDCIFIVCSHEVPCVNCHTSPHPCTNYALRSMHVVITTLLWTSTTLLLYSMSVACRWTSTSWLSNSYCDKWTLLWNSIPIFFSDNVIEYKVFAALTVQLQQLYSKVTSYILFRVTIKCAVCKSIIVIALHAYLLCKGIWMQQLQSTTVGTVLLWHN